MARILRRLAGCRVSQAELSPDRGDPLPTGGFPLHGERLRQDRAQGERNFDEVALIYVAARGTSVNCSICGSRTTTYPNGRRTLYCPRCDISIDRDVNAARNIVAKGGGVRFTPDGPPDVCKEAVKGNEATTAPILRADGGKVTRVNSP